MSRLLSKLSPLIHESKSRSVRLFSSSRTGPCVLISSVVEPSTDGGNVGEVMLYDLRTQKLVRTEKTFPNEIHDATLVGASHGWGFFSNRQDRSVVISDFLNPYASKSEPKMIPLPPFTTMPSCQTKVVCNVAMSSSPEPEDEDWVVGIKFLGKQLSLCRPRRDLRWTNIQTPFESWDSSKLMYSKKDERFYLLAPGGNYLCSWDLNFKKDSNPKFQELVLRNHPKLPSPRWMDSFFREDHWVESPSGECFLVRWYSKYTPDEDLLIAPATMVFREEDTKDGKKNMVYTRDTGDLGIFISKGEDFCVDSSACGLPPNSVFLHGRMFATTLNFDKKTFGCYEIPQGAPDWITYTPFWLAPFSS